MYYVNVYESMNSRPFRHTLSADTYGDAIAEAEKRFAEYLAVGGCLDLFHCERESLGREGRMYRRADGIEWVN